MISLVGSRLGQRRRANGSKQGRVFASRQKEFEFAEVCERANPWLLVSRRTMFQFDKARGVFRTLSHGR